MREVTIDMVKTSMQEDLKKIINLMTVETCLSVFKEQLIRGNTICHIYRKSFGTEIFNEIHFNWMEKFFFGPFQVELDFINEHRFLTFFIGYIYNERFNRHPNSGIIIIQLFATFYKLTNKSLKDILPYKYQKWSQEIMNSYYGENGIGVSNGN